MPKSANIYKTKTKNAQEAHEAIRPTNISYTPQKMSKYLDKDELRLYELIWKRTVACQMSDAIFLRQSIDFCDAKSKILTRANGSAIKFDGFLNVYDAKTEEDEGSLLPTLNIKDSLEIIKPISPKQHFTSPKSRYTEASLVKEMEELGIGRPSTYSSIIRILQEREYVHVEKRQFHPDIKGVLVTSFLKSFFTQYIEYDFTANLETELDLISDGKMNKLDFLNKFWNEFESKIQFSLNTENTVVNEKVGKLMEDYMFSGTHASEKVCKACKSDEVEVKSGKFGAYVTCHTCGANSSIDKYLNSFAMKNEDGSTNINYEGQIGVDELGNIISKKCGKFGDYVEQSSGKDVIKRASLPAFIKDLNLENALFLLSLPKVLGKNEENEDVSLGIGKFGPYLVVAGAYTNINPENHDIMHLTIENALEIIKTKPEKGTKPQYQKKTIEIGLYPKSKDKILIGKSKYGIYALYKKKFYTIKDVSNPEEVTLDMAVSAIDAGK